MVMPSVASGDGEGLAVKVGVNVGNAIVGTGVLVGGGNRLSGLRGLTKSNV
jgi:hypothetical protein